MLLCISHIYILFCITVFTLALFPAFLVTIENFPLIVYAFNVAILSIMHHENIPVGHSSVNLLSNTLLPIYSKYCTETTGEFIFIYMYSYYHKLAMNYVNPETEPMISPLPYVSTIAETG